MAHGYKHWRLNYSSLPNDRSVSEIMIAADTNQLFSGDMTSLVAVSDRDSEIGDALKIYAVLLDPSVATPSDGDILVFRTAGNKYVLETKPAGGAGGGDMEKSMYDPTTIEGDAFDMDNMVESATKKILTNTERTKLAGIENGATADQSGSEIKTLYETEADTNEYSDAEKTKVGHISITQAVDLDDIETRVNGLDAAVVLVGSWDASAGTFPGGGSAQAGALYMVSVGGTVDGVEFNINDRIVAITDNASTTTYTNNWFRRKYTDDVQSVAGKTGAVSLDADDVSETAGKKWAAETGADITDAENVGSSINGVDTKSTPVDADIFGFLDSAASFVLKKLSWSNIKAALKTYFDTLYLAVKTIGIADDNLVEIDSASVQSGEIPRFTANGLESRTNAELQSQLGYLTEVKKSVTFVLFESDTSVATGNGKVAFTIPADLNGLNLSDVIASVHTKGITGTTDVQIRRRRAGSDVDMLSTKITIGDEFYATDEVIDGANDDVQTGDQIYPDVDAVHSGTAPLGLSVTVTFS